MRASKFVNPPPAIGADLVSGPAGRDRLLARYVTDPGIRLVTVAGRGGIGKTAMVCRLLKGLEAGRIPDVEGDAAAITVGGIVYLSRNGVHKVEYPTLVADLLRLLPAEEARAAAAPVPGPDHSPAEMMLAVLEAFPAGEPVVVLLDNLESVMDAERETLAEQALHEALSRGADRARARGHGDRHHPGDPAALVKVEPGRQRQLRLEKGLGSPDAQIVLRELDDDGHLGLRDAPDELLDGLRQHTRGFPRALEAVKAILDGDHTLTPHDLLDRTRHLPEDQVVQVLVGEAYELLDAPAQQVMQALSVYPGAGLGGRGGFLAPAGQPHHRRRAHLDPAGPPPAGPVPGPALLPAPARSRVRPQPAPAGQPRRFSSRVHARRACTPVPPTTTPRSGHRGNPGAPWKTSGRSWPSSSCAATPATTTPRPPSWPTSTSNTCRCGATTAPWSSCTSASTGGSPTPSSRPPPGPPGACATTAWAITGRRSTCTPRRWPSPARSATASTRAAQLGNLGNCYSSLGEYRQAIDLHTQALAIARDTGDRQGEGIAWATWGTATASLGDYRQAIDLHTQALAIAREIGDRQGEGGHARRPGFCYASLGDYRQAIDLHTQALAIARDIGDRQRRGRRAGQPGELLLHLG